MSTKRAATTELNHDNWDQDDPAEHEEMGTFKAASKDVLEKRVIRTAKRRGPIGGDEPKKGVFSGFGGFNKAQPSSFDFLANLTNGNKTSSSPKSKSDTAVTSSLFSSKPPSSSPNVGLFGPQVSSTPATKSPFASATTLPSSLFGGSPTNTQTVTSLFTASKADSTVGDSPFKSQPISSSNDSISAGSSKTTNVISNTSGSQVTSTIFGAPTTSTNVTKSLFSSTNSTPFKMQPVSMNATKSLFSDTNTTPFQIQPVSSSTTMQSGSGTTSTTAISKSINSIQTSDNKETPKDDKKMAYYAQLKGLNESVSDWITKHVEETPLCILSPIFKDYEKHLKEIQDKYQESDDEDDASKKNDTTETSSSPKSAFGVGSQSIPTLTGNSNFSSFPVGKTDASPSAKLNSFGSPNNGNSLSEQPKFSFGINSTASSPPSGGFSFGVSTPQSSTTTGSPFTATTNLNSGTSPFSATSSLTSAKSPFSATSNIIPEAGTGSNGAAAPFSFGIGKPFSFNSSVQKTSTETKDDGKEEEDEPPKVEFTPVVEENSVFDKKCKVFVKKNGNFVDNGVGTLYIKKVEQSGKHQLLVRANTNLGNVLVNLILASAIPTQRMGKNNVMMVCIPTPDSKPPPTPILIRVKTAEEADELLETLNKYKS